MQAYLRLVEKARLYLQMSLIQSIGALLAWSSLDPIVSYQSYIHYFKMNDPSQHVTTSLIITTCITFHDNLAVKTEILH